MSSKKKHGRGNRSEDSDYDDDDNNSEYDEVVNARGEYQTENDFLQVHNFREQWERVICPTIQMKYVTIRCNLNNEVRKAYKGKSFLNMFVLVKRT